MEPSLAAVQYLANSPNRVRVLSALLDDRATRKELQDAADASRSTVARVLDESQDRAWVNSRGSRYWLTPFGRRMVTDFRSYLETVEGLQHLGEMVNHFPPPLFSLDFRHLRDATVVEPTPEDPSAPFSRAYEYFTGATRYRGLTHTAFPHFTKAVQEGSETGRLEHHSHVIEKSFIDEVSADPDRSSMWTFLSNRTWIYDGTVPISLHIIDGTVLVWLGETRGEVSGLLESENDAVLSWAESLFETYRSRAEPPPEE